MNQLSPRYKGMVIAAVMIIASLFSYYVLKNPIEGKFQYVLYLIFTFGIIWSMITYARSDNGFKRFKDFFSIGFKTFVIIALFMAVFTFIFFTFHPEFRDDNIAENSKLLLQQGNHLPNEIAENAKQLKKMFMPLMISITVFKYLIIGALITLIAAGFITQNSQRTAKN